MVVDYWQVYDAMGVLRDDFLVNAAHEFDSVRNESGGEVWIKRLAISTVV